MIARRRDGTVVETYDGQGKVIRFLYDTPMGKLLLPILIRPRVSRLGGWILDRGISRGLVAPFIRRNHLNMEDYPPCRYRSFNDFFTRQIRPECRPIDRTPEVLISPCDGKLTAISIQENTRFQIKGTDYTMETLLNDTVLAERYRGGTLLLFRLSVDDYHRYCHVAEGVAGSVRHIAGRYHTVNPFAAEKQPIYHENTREYSLLRTEQFGEIITMEVGALLVGRIKNTFQPGNVFRGEEKGRFEFGGSTVILILQQGKICVDGDILKNSCQGEETVVKMGERIGRAG